MRKVAVGAMGFAVGAVVCIGSAQAAPYTIDDTINPTEVQRVHSRTGEWTTWSDYIGGPDFDTFGIDVSFSGGMVNFDIYTNFNEHLAGTSSNGYTYDAFLADLALDVDGDGSYEYGVVLMDHDLWSRTGTLYGTQPPALQHLDTGLYKVETWQTSHDFFKQTTPDPATGGTRYGGAYDPVDRKENPFVAIGAVTSDNPVDGSGDPTPVTPFSVTKTSTGSSTDLTVDPLYIYSFSFDVSHLVGLGGDLKVFWSTATCANDVVTGKAPVPEPGTMLLLGSGLLGLAGFGRKRFGNR